MVESRRVPTKGRIRASIEKLFVRVPKNGKISVSTRKMEESVRVRGKGRIRVSIEKLFKWVPEKGPINVSTEKWKNPGEYQKKVEYVRVSKTCPGKYRKRVEFV